MSQFRFSRHANNNLRLYNITENDVETVVANPDFIMEKDEKISAIGFLPNKFFGLPLKVVYKRDGNIFFIITTYPLKNFKGFLDENKL
ncbi:MAG: DUF4258 domain-containing protein [Ignavibacteria bacterium]|nr:DUF4258 domain-containing protein [Ignavibacteria bacterium]